MKSKALLTILPYLFASGIDFTQSEKIILTDEDKKEINELRKKSDLEGHRQRLLNKGLIEFEIEGFNIIALNYKNALRKINNIKKAINT